MAPIIAIGSSALVAGTAASAGATAKKAVNPTITICEAAHGAFSFALNGSALTLPKPRTTERHLAIVSGALNQLR
jgi:hypothetical protein